MGERTNRKGVARGGLTAQRGNFTEPCADASLAKIRSKIEKTDIRGIIGLEGFLLSKVVCSSMVSACYCSEGEDDGERLIGLLLTRYLSLALPQHVTNPLDVLMALI